MTNDPRRSQLTGVRLPPAIHSLVRAATLALAWQQVATATLAAQNAAGAAEPTHPACALVTEQEVEAATGLDYGPGEYFGPEFETIEGAGTCMWGGPGGLAGEDRPELHVVLIAPGPRGSYTESQRKVRPRAACTRKAVRGIGDDAVVETCADRLFGASVYAKAGKADVVVRVYQTYAGMPNAAVEPAAIALAKAAVARARGD